MCHSELSFSHRFSVLFLLVAVLLVTGISYPALSGQEANKTRPESAGEAGDNGDNETSSPNDPAENDTEKKNEMQEEEEDKREKTQKRAEAGTDTLDEIVITAKRRESRRKLIGSSISVIDRDEMKQRNEDAVSELLRTVPGLEVSRSGGPGKDTNVFIRGAGSDNTLVLIDGVRANSTTTGSFDFGDLRATNVDRIEVVRGPQSTLYGSEAMGGIINIITAKGHEGLSGETSIEGGSNNRQRGSFRVAGGTNTTTFSLAGNYLETDGISAAAESSGNTENDRHENRTLSGNLNVTLPKDGDVQLNVRNIHGENDIDDFVFGTGPVDDENRLQTRDATYGSLNLKQPITDRWTQNASIKIHDEELTIDDPDDPGSESDLKKEIAGFSMKSDVELTRNDTLSAGFEIEEREGRNRGSLDRRLYTRSFFLQNDFTWKDRLSLTAGVRLENHDLFGEETTYRVTGSYLDPDSNVRFHGSYGTGFRAPDLNELFFPGFGNRNLDPEISRGYDIGLEKYLFEDRATLGITYFRNRFEDLIEFQFGSGFQNVRTATTKGVELQGEVNPIDHLKVKVTHTFLDTENELTGSPLDRRPEYRTTFQTTYSPSDHWNGTLSLIRVTDRFDNGGSVKLDDYTVVDLSLNVFPVGENKMYLKVDNLLDEDYQEVNGYSTRGLVFRVGTEFQW